MGNMHINCKAFSFLGLAATSNNIPQSIVGVYLLAVMWRRSPSLDSTAPGTLTSPGAKASFYVIHCLPEWLAATTLLSCNVRKTFGTGLFGDWRGVDDRPKDIASAEKRKAKKAVKKAEKNGSDMEKPLVRVVV